MRNCCASGSKRLAMLFGMRKQPWCVPNSSLRAAAALSVCVSPMRGAASNRGMLTPCEVQVVELIATGMRNKEIVAPPKITDETVHAHAKTIFGKLSVHDRTAAVTIALRRGIVHMR